MAVISTHGGAYLDRSFEPERFFAVNGRELPTITVRKLIAVGKLEPARDALFSGDSQSFQPTGR